MNKIKILLLCVIILLASFNFSIVNAEENQYKISGYIDSDFSYASDNFKSGFLVELVGSSIQAVSDSSGYFELDNVPFNSSGYTIKISKDVYLSREITGVKVTGNLELGSKTEPVKMWAGDFKVNGVRDNAINMIDIVQVAKSFGNIYLEYRQYCPETDINGDLTVNMADVIILAKHFNQTPANYPEPTIII
ncbi:MAG: hypothetical protein Q8942_08745 [Bacillota bacterium]|nr:hypothetical protein [Bacillota bacterium]